MKKEYGNDAKYFVYKHDSVQIPVLDTVVTSTRYIFDRTENVKMQC